MSANLLIGLAPALSWGVLPVLVAWIGGRPVQQIVGTTLGALIASIIVAFFVSPRGGADAWLYGSLSGGSWAFGQFYQYRAYRQIGVSQALPISTGLQLVGTSLAGVLLLGEWPNIHERLIGGTAVLTIIAGVFLTTRHENKSDGGALRAGLVTLVISTFGYVGYSYFPRVRDVDGWDAFMPQASGMVVVALLLALIDRKETPWSIKTLQNIGSGLVFAVGALTYLISARRIGVASGFALTQMNVVIATLGGVFILGERKTIRELIAILAGLALVVAGGVLIGIIH